MDKGVYLLMSGARESMLAQARVANNLANVSTTGFRADLQSFRSMPSIGDGHQSRVFVQSERPGYNFSEGGLITTGNPLDVAIKGDGWIAVQRPDGSEAYTRAGDLKIQVLDRIKLVNPVANTLKKGVDGLFENINGIVEPADASVNLVNEALEGSNVNAISELTDMIALSRQFEMKVKFMKTFKELGDRTDSLMRVS